MKHFAPPKLFWPLPNFWAVYATGLRPEITSLLLQTLRPVVHYACLRLCSAIVHFIRNNCLYFVC